MALSQIVSVVGWAGSVLLAVLVVRLLINGLFRQFPWFARYISFVLLSSMVALWVYGFYPRAYFAVYWVSEVTSLLLGVAVSFEALSKAFAIYPAIRNMGRTILRALLGIAILRVLLAANLSAPQAAWFELERDVRLMQALTLISICLLSAYYAIKLNRNQLGIICGYSLFISFSVVNLALRPYVADTFVRVWDLLQPLQYIICELIWCVFLWKVAAGVLADSTVPGLSGDGLASASPAAILEGRLRRLRQQTTLGSTT